MPISGLHAFGPGVHQVVLTREQFAVHVAQLRETFTSPVPGLDARLLQPPAGSPWSDTNVPALADRYLPTAGGLLVPAATAPGSLHSTMKTYMTASEILGGPMPKHVIERLLQQVSVADALAIVGGLIKRVRERDADTTTKQLRMVAEFCRGDTRKLAEALARDHSVFLAPQLLLAVAKLAVLVEPADRETTAADPVATIIQVELGLGDYLGTLEEDETRQWGELPESLALELVANQHFNRTEDIKAMMGRYEALWNVLPARRDPALANLHHDLFMEHTGATLDDCAYVGFGLLATAMAQATRLGPASIDRWTATPGQRAALDLFIADVDDVRALLLEELGEFGLDWSANTFRRFPFVRHPDGSVTLVDIDHLVARLSGAAAHFEVLAAIEAVPTSARERKRRYGDFKRFRGLVAEDLVGESLVAMAPPAIGGARFLWTEEDMNGMWPDEPGCDFVVDFGTAWVCVEVVSHALTVPTATAKSVERLDADIDMIAVGKAAQLEATIQRLVADESAFTGQGPVPGKPIHPVVVATNGFPVNPITTSVIRERLASSGLLTHPRVGPLEIIDQGDLENIEHEQVTGSFSLADLLGRKAHAGMRDLAMDQFMHTELHLGLNRPPRLDLLGSQFMDRMLKRAKEQMGEAA